MCDDSLTPYEVAVHIRNLTAAELVELKQLLDEWEGPGGEFIGVREPRRPAPESPGDEAAKGWPEPAALPEDYWESAQ